MKIGYFPFENFGNEYVTNMRRILSLFGVVCPIVFNYKFFLKFNSFDYVFFNWRENYFVDQSTGKVSIKGVVKEFLILFYVKYISKKTCLVVHNNYPHNTEVDSVYAVCKIQSFYRWFFDLKICHSGDNSDNGFYVPHPKYNVSLPLDRSCGDYYLIFGRVERYKKIENAIEFLPDINTLYICGKCTDDDYLENIISMAGPNVRILNEYIDNDKLIRFISESKGVILTADGEDMLVSGAFHLAMSCGANVFSISTPYLKWYKNFYGSTNVYCFDSMKELWGYIESLRCGDIEQKSCDYLAEHSDESVSNYLKENVFFKGL